MASQPPPYAIFEFQLQLSLNVSSLRYRLKSIQMEACHTSLVVLDVVFLQERRRKFVSFCHPLLRERKILCLEWLICE